MKRFAQILLFFVLIILIIPVFLPNKIDTEVVKEYDATPGMLYEEFNNLKEFSEWEPWANADSLAKIEYFAPYRGEGAGYRFERENLYGEFIIKDLKANQFITYDLDGLKLGKTSKMNVQFESINPQKTKVIWKIESEKIGYFTRYYTYFISDKLKDDMEVGLQNLEKRLKIAPLTSEQAGSIVPGMIQKESFDGEKLLTVLNETSLEQKETETATEESIGLIFSYLTDFLKLSPNQLGNPVSYYEFVDLSTKKQKFYTGYPITESVKLGEGMQLFSIPACDALISIHQGSYESLDTSINKMKDFATKNKLKLDNSFWLEYQNDPQVVKDKEKLLTKIYIPITK